MMTNWGYHHAYLISSWLQMIDYISLLATWAILDPFSGSQSTSDTPKCGFPKSFHFSCLQISLLIIMIPYFFYWIVDLFSILLSISLHHISGVSSFDFAPEGAGWLHHWTTFQLNLNLIVWSIWLPFLMSLSLGASHHLGHHVPLFLTSLTSAHHLSTSHNIFWFWVSWTGWGTNTTYRLLRI